MDNSIRFAAYLVVGAVLIFCNIWFLRALRSSFWSNDYVIMPIRLVGKEDKEGAQGIALAQMLQARLTKIANDLTDAQRQLSTIQKTIATSSVSADAILFLPAFRANTVKMPTSLLEPANINVAVAGVEVKGVVAWIQALLVRQRTLTFTMYFVNEHKMIVAGDARPLTNGDDSAIWIESVKPQDQVISELAYTLLLKHLTSAGGNRLDHVLSPQDLQLLAEAMGRAVDLNRRISQGGHPQPEEFGTIFHALGPIAQNASGWPELRYFAANLAERAGENGQAVQLYTQFKEAGSLAGTSGEVKRLIDDGTVDRKISSLSHLPSRHGKFDFAVTMGGSTEHSVVYYETALGSAGSEIALAVQNKFAGDFDTLTEIFGGITLPEPLNIIIASIGGAKDGTGGAYHYACDAPDLYVDAKLTPAVDPERSSFFVVTQAVDVFGALQNKGWYCGASNGTGLKRVLAAELYPNQITPFSTAAAWLDSSDRPDYVNENKQTDMDPVSTGCAVLFLNYMHTQLKIPWAKIVQTGGLTLSKTYSNLGLGNDGFIKFKQLMDRHFPIGKPSALITDNPFPLSDRP